MKRLKIEYFDKETGEKKIENNAFLTDNEYLLSTNNKKIKDELEKFKGKGKFYKYDDLISYIEILRRYESDKRSYKPKAKDFIKKYNDDTGNKIKDRTFNSFLDRIEKDISVYSEISNSLLKGKSSDEVIAILKEKLHFNVKM